MMLEQQTPTLKLNQATIELRQFKKKLLIVMIAVIAVIVAVDVLIMKQVVKKVEPSAPIVDEAVVAVEVEKIKKEKIESNFLTMKKMMFEATEFSEIEAMSADYFTAQLTARIQALTIEAATDAEKLQIFQNEILLQNSSYYEIDNVTATIEEEKVRLSIKGKNGAWQTMLVYENGKWLYTGEEERLTIVDVEGNTYKVVTPETAEYETTLDENGQEIQVMKAGQAIWSRETAAEENVETVAQE